MCMLVIQIAMVVMGIIALATGKIALTRNLVVRGAMARIIGVVLIIPLPLAFAIGLAIGVGIAAQGKTVNDIPLGVRLLDPLLVVGAVILAVILGIIGREPAKKKRKRPVRDDFDDEDDRLDTPPPIDGPREPGKETGIQSDAPPPPRRRPPTDDV